MALMQRMDLRQGQSLVMTPQLQQAIKLLQMSNLELQAYVEGELERNPLLERDERGSDVPKTNAREPAADTVDAAHHQSLELQRLAGAARLYSPPAGSGPAGVGAKDQEQHEEPRRHAG